MSLAPRILVVDNYDSFVFTLVDYLERLGAQTEVFRNDAVPPLDRLGRRGTGTEQPYDGVLISPGPGNPRGAGASMQTIAYCAEHSVPMLGVCLGHQALAEVFGGTVTHAPQLRHGKTSDIHHNGQGIFASLP
ncbi:MAG: gamma-glutamyl-gamma-aminobutyrate hydrolase family protein, partial [Bifidobacteriaceae bacterium]|nr:gamma-glutamyl-gamma-aminobutyrate hydrolase family protein [Bifidobacteriaceae bacterium]